MVSHLDTTLSFLFFFPVAINGILLKESTQNFFFHYIKIESFSLRNNTFIFSFVGLNGIWIQISYYDYYNSSFGQKIIK